MNSLVTYTQEFRGYPMTIAEAGGQKLLRATDLTGPTGNTERAIRKLVATLPESERGELEVPTLGGTQKTLFVTQAGALEVVRHRTSRKRLWVLASGPRATVIDLAARRQA